MEKSGSVIYRRILVCFLMALLIFPMLGIYGRHVTIQERIQPISRPEENLSAVIRHEWQSFLEQQFLHRIGSFRSVLILFHNETIFRLFPSRPNDGYIGTEKFGYYPVDTIRRLNNDVLQYDAIKQHYQRAANRLRILQELLGNHGVSMLVVTPPPKVRVYPEYVAPYLVAPPESIMSRAVSYGDILEESGVHVLNVQRLFSARKHSSPWPFFTTTSFHWSFLAGCIMAGEIIHKAEVLTGRSFFPIDCSVVEYGKSKWSDTDIASILNIFSTDRIIGDAPFPKIIPQQKTEKSGYKILVIGDSFSDQIIYAFIQALPDMDWSADWLTRYDSFVKRQTFGREGNVTSETPLQLHGALSEILKKELLILEVSDGNIYRDAANLKRMEFGATQVLLDGLLMNNNGDNGGIIDPANVLTTGWRTLDKKQWCSTGHLASIVFHPPTNNDSLQLQLDVENKALHQQKPHSLIILLDSKPIGQIMMIRGRGVLNLRVPAKKEWADSLVSEISLQDADGHPLDLLLHGIRMIGTDTGKIIK
jgi:hypothetical protein